jgi:hypothetical protein
MRFLCCAVASCVSIAAKTRLGHEEWVSVAVRIAVIVVVSDHMGRRWSRCPEERRGCLAAGGVSRGCRLRLSLGYIHPSRGLVRRRSDSQWRVIRYFAFLACWGSGSSCGEIRGFEEVCLRSRRGSGNR